MKILLALATMIAVLFGSCKKDKPVNTGETLNFSTLAVEDTNILVNEEVKISATASGSNITYTWVSTGSNGEASGNILPGSNASNVYFTICHADRFKVSCTVKDSENKSITKSVYITTNFE